MERIYLNNTYGHGLFIESSRMNHSCLPCVEMSMDEGKETEVRSVRDIEEGEEIRVQDLKRGLLRVTEDYVKECEEIRRKTGTNQRHAMMCHNPLVLVRGLKHLSNLKLI